MKRKPRLFTLIIRCFMNKGCGSLLKQQGAVVLYISLLCCAAISYLVNHEGTVYVCVCVRERGANARKRYCIHVHACMNACVQGTYV